MEKNNQNRNLKIALFMDAEIVGEFPDHKLLSFSENNYPDNWTKFHSSSTLKYDKSFDWLVPVVKKITLLCKSNIGNVDFDKKWNDFFDYQSYNFFTGDLEPIYTAVVNFLDWYNDYE